MDAINTNQIISEKKRYRYIDAAKGIAIFFVVMGHVIFLTMAQEPADVQIYKGFGFIGISHMPLFMFLSGLVVSSHYVSAKNLFQTLIKRAHTLLVPFLVFGLAYAVFKEKTFDYFIFSPVKCGYWYLWVLFLFYCIQYVSVLITRNNSHKCYVDLIFGGGISALLVCLHSQFSGTMVADFLCLERMASTYPFFFMGFMIKNYGLNKWLFTNELLYIGCLLFVVIFLIKPLPIPGLNYWVPIAIIIVLMSFLYSLESSSSKFFKLLSTVGRSTLDIYILHYFVLTMFSLGFINQFFKSGNYSVFLEILVTTIVSSIIIVVCMFVSKLFRKSKYINKYVFNQV